jgi:hypothetical protein
MTGSNDEVEGGGQEYNNLRVCIMDHAFVLKDDCTPTTFLNLVHGILSDFLIRHRKFDLVPVGKVEQIIDAISPFIEVDIDPNTGVQYHFRSADRARAILFRLRDAIYTMLKTVLWARPFKVLPVHQHATNTVSCWAALAQKQPPRLHILVHIAYCNEELLDMFNISKRLRYDPYSKEMEMVWKSDLKLFKI